MTAIDAPRTSSFRLSDEAIAFLGVVLFLAVAVSATLTWGLPGLAMTALATVPVIYAILILLSVGK
jgi:hypothetical protein